jgi:hypothetical protein
VLAVAVGAFLVPATAVWAALGAAASSIGAPRTFLWLTFAYAVCYALAEGLSTRVRSPSSSWQVPFKWLKDRSQAKRIAIWGAMLGPGLLTRNPFAGMWVIPLLLGATGSALSGALAGATCGGLHGAARLAGIIRVQREAQGPGCESALVVLRTLRWRAVDAIALACLSGALGAYLI